MPCTIQVCTNSHRPAFCWKWTQRSVLRLLRLLLLHPVSHILDTCTLIFSSCALFTVHCNRMILRHPTPPHVITARAREGGPKKHREKEKWPCETHQLHMRMGSLAHCRVASTVIPLMLKATFTLSIQPNLGLPRTRASLTSAINTLLAIRYSSILSICPTISILSDPLLSLTLFLFHLSYAPRPAGGRGAGVSACAGLTNQLLSCWVDPRIAWIKH